MSIAARAVAAKELLTHRTESSPLSRHTAADIARAAARLAALLGIDPNYVRPDMDWNWISLPLVPLTLHVSDPNDPDMQYSFSYRDPLYDDEAFFLMGPCPLCDASVPLAAIRTLADLGTFLTNGPEPLSETRILPGSYPDEFDRYPAHSSKCPYREGGC